MTREQIQKEVYDLWVNTKEGEDFSANIAKWIYDTFVGKKDRAKVSDWIESWCNLWPRGVMSGNRAIRPHPKDVISKMQSFVKDYGYDRETIFKATLDYLSERMDEDWLYTKRGIYFIDKQGEGSLLAERCDKILNVNESEYGSKGDSYFV